MEFFSGSEALGERLEKRAPRHPERAEVVFPKTQGGAPGAERTPNVTEALKGEEAERNAAERAAREHGGMAGKAPLQLSS